ncbi:capsular polysaccharide export protein, LipB/KpsS family [Sinorhizobium meliloti]|uniref:capsular polysaccharide export protein, LipB/KpsS family n=1 Tax=Rhizobium meliloti TaxID=382 RepID=UPI001F3B1E3F|nr:capsular polysaccharide biosynthesis protein [Sinorhizobium meliloti]
MNTSVILAEAAKTPFRVTSGVLGRYCAKQGKPPLFLFGFNDWKTFMHDWFPDREVIFTPMNMWPVEFEINWKWRIWSDPRSEVLAWQYKAPPQIKSFCLRHKIPFHYVEDGFIRSIGIGALHTPPMSMVFDRQDMYFNANAPTDLEDILRKYDFDGDPALMERAVALKQRLLDSRISKYNSGEAFDPEKAFGAKLLKRVLVIGQVERDASIAYGSQKKYKNNDLVWLAVRENPDAQVIYKPHPEVLQGTAATESDPYAVSGAAMVLDQDVSLSDALDTIDHVYTITSLAGFEALLRGIKVTTFGCPFYSGWGVTDDRQPNPRRGRTLSVDQIFAAAYILYPKYFDPIAREHIEPEKALDILSHMRGLMPKREDRKLEEASDAVTLLAKAIARELRN